MSDNDNRGRRFVLWGSAGHAKVLADLLHLQGASVVALFDNREVEPALEGVGLHLGEAGFERWADGAQDLHEVGALVAIGGANGAARLAIQGIFRRHGLLLSPVVHPDASVSANAQLGEGTQVLAHAVVAAGARLGEACIVNHRASVDHECVLGQGVHLAPGATLCGCVVLGDHAMVGAGAVVLPRLRIGDNAVVGAGAVVTRDVPPGAVVLGNPARLLPHRSIRPN